MAKTKITMFLDSDLIKWLDMNRDEETSRSALVRILIRKAMKAKSRKETQILLQKLKLMIFLIQLFSSTDLIPDDLKAIILIFYLNGGLFDIRNKGT